MITTMHSDQNCILRRDRSDAAIALPGESATGLVTAPVPTFTDMIGPEVAREDARNLAEYRR